MGFGLMLQYSNMVLPAKAVERSNLFLVYREESRMMSEKSTPGCATYFAFDLRKSRTVG